MTSYKSSEHVTKWFCKICGAHMLDRVDGGEHLKWYVAVSLVDAEEEVWKYTGHHFVESTKDGGAAVMMGRIGGVEMGMWKERKIEGGGFYERGNWSLSESVAGADGVEEKGMLRAKCHCGGVDFWIALPDVDEARPEPPVTKNPSKWSGRHCVCNSCRTTTSSFISSWINISSSALQEKAKSPLISEDSACLGTTYKSAKDVSRTFCNVCGASVSYRREEGAGVLKIAAGLLEGRGSRAESRIEWIKEVHETEYARLPQATQAFALGVENAG